MINARTLVLFSFASLFGVASPTAQAVWRQLYPPTQPTARERHAMCYDSVHQRVIVFGGVESSTFRSDTWAWDGTTWTQVSQSGPATRLDASMVFDPVRGECVLFGGADGAAFGDTWTFDGTSWRLAAMTGPSPRSGANLVFDSARGRVLLYGGRNSSGASFSDLWEWRGTGWIQLTTMSRPPGSAEAMCYDSVRDRVVVFGLRSQSVPNGQAQTWEWDGSTWARVFPPTDPGRASGSMAFDPLRGRAVFFARGQAPFGTWEWDGTNWSLNIAAPRHGGAATRLVYEEANSRVLSFGFDGGDPGVSETWEYVARPTAAFEPFGVGCLGTGGVPSLFAAPGQLPVLGQSMTVELRSLPHSTTALGILGRSDSSFGGLVLPTPLDAIGMPGCTLLASLDFTTQLPTLAGFGLWSIQIPNSAALDGQSFFVQGLIVDAAANPLGLTLSNAGRGQIGSRP